MSFAGSWPMRRLFAGLVFCMAAAGCGKSETPSAEAETAAQDQQTSSLPMLAIPGKTAAPAKATAAASSAGTGKTSTAKAATPAKSGATKPSKPTPAEEIDPDDDPEDIETDRKEDMEEDDNEAAPKSGTPEALVRDATQLML